MSGEDARWIELQLYFLVTDVVLKRNNFEDVKTLLKLISVFEDFDMEKAEELCGQMLVKPNIRPHKPEFIILATLNNQKRSWVTWKIKRCNKTYSRILNQAKKNPPEFYARLSPEEIELAQKLVNAFNKIRKVGVPDDKHKRNVGVIQELRYGSSRNESLRLS